VCHNVWERKGRGAWVRTQVNPMGFVVDEVALGQVFFEFFGFLL
jgi:hypothetical protein